jgi:DNA-binding NarL/FixJ family response regulator
MPEERREQNEASTNRLISMSLRKEFDRLTPRELGLIVISSEGLDNQQIAEEWGIKYRTVEKFQAAINNKLGHIGVINRTTAVKWACEAGIFEDPLPTTLEHGHAMTPGAFATLHFVSEGYTSKEIADSIGRSYSMIVVWRGAIQDQLQVASMPQAVRLGYQPVYL